DWPTTPHSTSRDYCSVFGLKPTRLTSAESKKPTSPPVETGADWINPTRSTTLEATPPKSPLTDQIIPSESTNLQSENHESDAARGENNLTIPPVCDEGKVNGFDETDGSSRHQSGEFVEIAASTNEDPVVLEELIDSREVDVEEPHVRTRNGNSLGVAEPEIAAQTSSTLESVLVDPTSIKERFSMDASSESPPASVEEPPESSTEAELKDANCCGNDDLIKPTVINQLHQTPPNPGQPHGVRRRTTNSSDSGSKSSRQSSKGKAFGQRRVNASSVPRIDPLLDLFVTYLLLKPK
uniref:Uncharacterized protein n=1 Tax=Mesocestoides corti TaxID=53468 RepID=A0A5K3F9S5_MESCO